MRYKQNIRNEVRQLRINGLSLNQINRETKIPITTIRNWTSDISLSKEQKEILTKRSQMALQKGRIKAQIIQKKMKIKNEKEMHSKGKEEIRELTHKEFFIAGVALYWAEGFKNKHEHRLGFCNSDPTMIKFYVNWLEKNLGINRKNLVIRLALNQSYRDKTKKIQKYWSKIVRIPLKQFTKTFYQNAKWKKQYNNHYYHGVLRIHVKNSLNSLLKMKGWIEGLKSAKIINNNSPG